MYHILVNIRGQIFQFSKYMFFTLDISNATEQKFHKIYCFNLSCGLGWLTLPSTLQFSDMSLCPCTQMRITSVSLPKICRIQGLFSKYYNTDSHDLEVSMR